MKFRDLVSAQLGSDPRDNLTLMVDVPLSALNAQFAGDAQCKTAFHPDVGTVEACASCHRIAGTPDQVVQGVRAFAGTGTIGCSSPAR